MKGVSALFGVVLIIVFTLSLATLIFGFLTANIKETTERIGNKTALAVDCASASISIEDVFASQRSPTNFTVRVIVKNTGFTDGLVIQGAEVFNKTGSNFTAGGIPLSNFNRGNIATLVFENVSFTSCPKDFSKAIVTTSCGAISDTFDGTPKC